jgi:hypothetical protein
MSNSEFWRTFKEVDSMLKKQAFIQMPGGNKEAQMGGDPAAGGMPPPGDPAAMGMPPPGMDPAMMGGDPAAMGMPPPGDPAAMGMPPPGMDPAMMGMPPPGDPAAAGAPVPDAAPGSPMITISLDQLFEIIQKVLGLAKKVGVNGSGVQQPAPAESQGISQDQLKATIYEALGQMAG